MEIDVVLRLPPDVGTVPVVRTICNDAMARLGVSEECRFDIALAVTEACANVVEHAAAGVYYRVQVSLDPERCRIQIVDDGEGVDPALLERPMPASAEDRGRGIALMRLLTDRMNFDVDPDNGTVLQLEKRLELDEAAPLNVLPSRDRDAESPE